WIPSIDRVENSFLALSLGVSQICPSATAVNARGSKITPATVLGNDALLTRFNITAATATCPSYGFPRASPYTALALRCISFCENPAGVFVAVGFVGDVGVFAC